MGTTDYNFVMLTQWTDMVLTKVCSKCKTEKFLDCFSSDSRKKQGVRSQCRDCNRYRAAELRRKKGIPLAYDSEYYNQLSFEHGFSFEQRRMLGRLCKNNHKWNGLDVSLMTLDKHGIRDECLECKNNRSILYNAKPETKHCQNERDRYYRWLEKSQNGKRNCPAVWELVEREMARYVTQEKQAEKASVRAKEKFRKRYKNNLEAERLRVQVYKYSNPEKVLKWADKRRVLIAEQADGTLTRERIMFLFGTARLCPYCFVVMGTSKETRKTLDHIVPISKGGLHSIANVVICCQTCNVSKGAKTLDEWLAETLAP